jgi:WhiB family redox-sensing transcriptional regulator
MTDDPTLKYFDLAAPPEWADQAACADLADDTFYPSFSGRHTRRYHRKVEAAKAICRSCPVANQCLTYAYESGDHHGIYGGTTPEERGRRSNR